MQIMTDTHRHLRPDADNASLPANEGAFFFACGPRTDWHSVARLAEETTRGARTVTGFGVHPWYLSEAEDFAENAAEGHAGWLHVLSGMIDRFPRSWVGEIGLDGLKGGPLPQQIKAFTLQLDLAASKARPVSVHCVRAFGPMLELFSARPIEMYPPAIVLHGFTGSKDFAQSLLRLSKKRGLRFYFGIGALTTCRLGLAQDLLRALPSDRIVVESDAHDDKDAQTLLNEAIVTVLRLRDDISAEQLERNATVLLGMP